MHDISLNLMICAMVKSGFRAFVEIGLHRLFTNLLGTVIYNALKAKSLIRQHVYGFALSRFLLFVYVLNILFVVAHLICNYL